MSSKQKNRSNKISIVFKGFFLYLKFYSFIRETRKPEVKIDNDPNVQKLNEIIALKKLERQKQRQSASELNRFSEEKNRSLSVTYLNQRVINLILLNFYYF